MALLSSLQKSTLLLFLVSVLFGLVVISAPVSSDATSSFFIDGACKYYSLKCKDPIIRKDWNTLSVAEKNKYLNAVKCLAQKPTLPAIHSRFTGTMNNFDDYVAVHSNQAPKIHLVGFFIIWHRYFVATYEKALRDECGYDGGQPYWNTAKDLASPLNINRYPIFSNTTGFGGNGPFVPQLSTPNPFNLTGRTGGGCVPGGPFGTSSTFKANVGPGNNTSQGSSTCLKRDFTPPALAFCAQSNVDAVLNQPNFTTFARQIENIRGASNFLSIHTNGHLGLGGIFGQIADFYSSPSDPLFYMHHTNLDRIYWQWQLRNPIKRLCEVGGPTIPRDYLLTQGPAVTLDFKVNIDVIAPEIAVGHLLSSVGGPLCYVYDRIQ